MLSLSRVRCSLLICATVLLGPVALAQSEQGAAQEPNAEQIAEQIRLDTTTRIKLKELAFGEVLYDYYQQNYFAALTRIDVAEQQNEIVIHRSHLKLLRGVMYLSYGMMNEAEKIFRQLLVENLETDLLTQIRFYLGQTYYLQGDFDQANFHFDKIVNKLPSNLQDDLFITRSQMAFASQDFNSAKDFLLQVSSESQQGKFAQFNLAIFYLRQDDINRAVELFEELFPDTESSDVERSLYDRANLALGYYFLEKEQVEKAREHLLNVRLDSPFTNRALLALGWTYYNSASPERAIAHWRSLLERDGRDPAVQEAAMALAFAYYQNGAKREALEAFVNAAALFGEQLSLIDSAIQDLDGKLFQQWLDDRGVFGDKVFQKWGSGDVPITGNPIEYYLQSAVASNEFNQFFQRFQETSHLQQVLERWLRQLPVYEQMLENHEERYQKNSPVVKQRTDQLLSGALNQRYQQLVSQAEEKLSKDDLWLLANEEEKELYHDLTELKSTIDSIPQSEFDLSEQKEQWRRIYGALMWQIADEYGPKRYQLKKAVDTTKAALEKLKLQSQSILSADQKAETRFLNYDVRIVSLRTKMNSSLESIEAIKNMSKQQMEEQLRKRLDKRKQELDFLLAQTELSIAKIQDEAVNKLLEQNQ